MKSALLRLALLAAVGIGVGTPRADAQSLQYGPFTNSVKIGIGATGTINTNVGNPGSYTVFGGGRDIGGTNDDFTFHSTSLGSDLRLGGGDFRIRVDGLEPNTAWTKAGLMLREAKTPGGKMVYVYTTPNGPTLSGQPGAGTFGFSVRTNDAGPAVEFPVSSFTNFSGGPAYAPPAYPNGADLRLLVTPGYIAGFVSADDFNWFMLGSTVNSGALTNLGLAASTGGDGPLVTVGVEYRNFPTAGAAFNPPSVDPIADQNISQNTAAVVGFRMYANNFYFPPVAFTPHSSNPAVVPNDSDHIILYGDYPTYQLTIIPLTNATGSTVISYGMGDVLTSVQAQFTLNVNFINYAPYVYLSGYPSGVENGPPIQIPLNVGDDTTPVSLLSASLTGSSTNNTLFPPQNFVFTTQTNGSGQPLLLLTPPTNQFGTFQISVSVTDTNGASATNSTLVFISPVNQPPTVTPALPNLASNLYVLNLVSNYPAQTITLTNIAPGPPNEYDQSATLSISNSSATLLTAVSLSLTNFPSPAFPATATLRFTPGLNKSGTAYLTVTNNDHVGSNNISRVQIQVNVHNTNWPPTLALSTSNAMVFENVSTNILLRIWDSETPVTRLQLTATNNGVALPSTAFGPIQMVGTNGLVSVTITPPPDYFGTNLVTVTVMDGDGGKAQAALTLGVQYTNHPPTLDPPQNLTIVQNSGPQTNFFTGVTPGPANENQTARVTVSTTNPSLFTSLPSVVYAPGANFGYVWFTPAPGTLGTALATLTVDDQAGFNNSTLSRAFRISVISSNDVLNVGQGTADFVNRAKLGATNRSVGAGFFNGSVAKHAPGSGIYLPAVSAAVGLAPVATLTADFNGDGWPDLVSAVFTTSNLVVLTNNGVGGFVQSAALPMAGGAFAIGVADFNHDGKVDLINGDNTTGNLSILTNNGRGGFALSSVLPTRAPFSNPKTIAIADFNGDGWPDVVCANRNFSTLLLYTNDHHGALVAAGTPNAGGCPATVVAADLNGDGRPDLVMNDGCSANLTVMLNDGHGGFGLPAAFPVGQCQTAVAIGDVNGDGWPDLVSANGCDNTLMVLTNNGNGSFSWSATVPVDLVPAALLVADVSGDGRPDLISANNGANNLSILTNDGAGGFSLAGAPLVGIQPFSLAAADVDGDGTLDLITPNSGTNTLSVLLNTPRQQPFIALSAFGQAFAPNPLDLPYAQLGGVIAPPPAALPTPLAMNPDAGAFYVPDTGSVYASQPGLVTITWTNPISGSLIPITYLVLNTPASGMDPAKMYVTDLNGVPTGAPAVNITNLTVIPHYNSLITAGVLGTNGISGGVQLRATNSAGSVVLEYRDAASGAFSNLQVLVINGYAADYTTTTNVGTWLAPNQPHTNGILPYISRGSAVTNTAMGYYAYRYDNGTNDPDTGRLFATQATPDGNQIEVFWFKRSYAAIVWPDELDHYQAKWPDGWQTNAVRLYLTRTDDGAATAAPAVNVPTLSVPNLTIHYNAQIPPIWTSASSTNNSTFWLESGSRKLQAQHFTGPILLHYNNSAPLGFIGWELVNVLPYYPDAQPVSYIGQQLHPALYPSTDVAAGAPQPFVARGGPPDSPTYVYQHASPDSNVPSSQEGYVFAIRRTTTTNQVEIFWKRLGLQKLEWSGEMDRYSLDWPSNQPALFQYYARGPVVNPGTGVVIPSVNQPSLMPYQSPTNNAILAGTYFTTRTPGWSLLKYTLGNDVAFQAVQAVDHRDARIYDTTVHGVTNGVEVLDPNHQGPGPGYVFIPNDPATTHLWDRYDWETYSGNTNDPAEFQTGQIIPVNQGNLEVWWYRTNQSVSWPAFVRTYQSDWYLSEPLVIASQQGSGPIDPTLQRNFRLYYQNDPTQPGFNPNDEHALIAAANGRAGQAVFAMRSDLGSDPVSGSQPFVMLKHRRDAGTNWNYRIFQVVAQTNGVTFSYPLQAGLLIQPPYPLSFIDLPPFPNATNAVFAPTFRDGSFRDRKGSYWAKAGGDNGGTNATVMRYFYPVQNGFFVPAWYQTNAWYATNFPAGTAPSTLPPAGARLPWLDLADQGQAGVPHNITNNISWPANLPSLYVGETLVKSKRGLPEIGGMISADLIYQQSVALSNVASAQIIDPTRIVTNQLSKSLANIALNVQSANDSGLTYFPTLPAHLRSRFWYDPTQQTLNFNGQWVDAIGTVEPQGYVLLNVLTPRDANVLATISSDPAFLSGLAGLQANAANPITLQPNQPFDSLALTAGNAQGTGYVTFIENNSTNLNQPSDPVAIHLMRVDWPLYRGEIKAVPSDNPLDDKLTLRHTGDFAGKAGNYAFSWYYCSDTNGFPSAVVPTGTNLPAPGSGWLVYADNTNGALDITLEGPGATTLEDHWFICRYTPLPGTFAQANAPTNRSAWTDPMLAEGWIKRVLQGITPFEQRTQNYQNTQVNTIVSMLAQAGARWLGSTPLNSQAVNKSGLIEIYTTILNRGMDLSINAGVQDPGVYSPLLLAAGRLADLYMLLGNEAFADAADPTIAYGTDDKQYGNVSTSIHCFMNQTSSLLEEELALLRGRDDSQNPSVQTYPVYNRLIWNFTRDINGGEVAYALNYNIADQNGGVSGVIDEASARALYPQGHGDAWGHYLSAIQNYYRLLTHPHYKWNPATESITVSGVPVSVNYVHEQKFAKAAAAKAQTGAQIINLTYRQAYVENPGTTWQNAPDGYASPSGSRAWSVGEWASRAGQGALFDWVVGNALIPPTSSSTGLQKIDRTTVLELRDIATAYDKVESEMDNADMGLNPLGLSQNSIPFDIDPSALTQNQGQTHFEQIYGRANLAINNAVSAFNNAAGTTQNLRRQADSLTDFQKTVLNQEVDFTNRLIEVFGYPYPEDIGPGATYPSGYSGPDLTYPHYNYIDYQDLTGNSPPNSTATLQRFYSVEVEPSGVVTQATSTVSINLSTEGLSFIKPTGWSKRRAPGSIQNTLGDLLQSRIKLLKGLQDYDNLINQIDDQTTLLNEQYNVNASEIQMLNTAAGIQTNLDAKILSLRKTETGLRLAGQIAVLVADGLATLLPTSVGLANDVTAPGRGAIKLAGSAIAQTLNAAADQDAINELSAGQAQQEEQTANNINLTTLKQGPGISNQLAQLKQLVRQEPGMRFDLFTDYQTMLAQAGAYRAALAKGQQILADRLRFREQTAAEIQSFRYKDMAFRIFRNDALQKYQAQFDLASRYVYLAAKAYDYETCLLPWDARGAGQNFLTEIVKAQDLGAFVNNQPITGSGNGLADSMASMSQNWNLVLRGQLGFNNPESETDRFSLRQELFRTQTSTNGSSLSVWTNTLWMNVVSNLYTLPEFVRYCIPFGTSTNAPAGGEPGIVITFPSTVTFAQNFFGWPLGGNDSAYDPSHFATKIRGVGVWFANYDNLNLSLTPRVYLVPAGNDVLRSPSGNLGTTREFQVVDQLLPVPFPNPNALQDPNYLPLTDSLNGTLADIRKFGSLRAYHDGGFTTDQMTYSSRLVGRSVWNRRWMLIIPAGTLSADRWQALNTFINGVNNDGNGVSDIKLFFQTYSYQGN